MAERAANISIDITDRCQMHCNTCTKWKVSDEVEKKELNTSQWKDILYQIRNWCGEGTSVTFAGGEPFLRKDIFDLFFYGHSLGLVMAVVTNGYNLAEYTDEIVKSKLKRLNISLNSIKDPSIHDKSRGTHGCCKKVCELIKNVMERKAKDKPNLDAIIATTILPENLDEIEEIIKFTKDRNMEQIVFQLIEDSLYFHPFGEVKAINTEKQKDSDKYLSIISKMSEKAVKVITKIEKLKDEGYPIYNSHEQLNLYKLFLADREKAVSITKCTVGDTNFSIDPYGNVRLCYNMAPIGSILEKTPNELWFSDEADKCREKIEKCHLSCRLMNCNYRNKHELSDVKGNIK